MCFEHVSWWNFEISNFDVMISQHHHSHTLILWVFNIWIFLCLLELFVLLISWDQFNHLLKRFFIIFFLLVILSCFFYDIILRFFVEVKFEQNRFQSNLFHWWVFEWELNRYFLLTMILLLLLLFFFFFFFFILINFLFVSLFFNFVW